VVCSTKVLCPLNMFSKKIAKVQRSYDPLCGHTTFVLLTLAHTMTIIDRSHNILQLHKQNTHLRRITCNKYSNLHMPRNPQWLDLNFCMARYSVVVWKVPLTTNWPTRASIMCIWWHVSLHLLTWCWQLAVSNADKKVIYRESVPTCPLTLVSLTQSVEIVSFCDEFYFTVIN